MHFAVGLGVYIYRGTDVLYFCPWLLEIGGGLDKPGTLTDPERCPQIAVATIALTNTRLFPPASLCKGSATPDYLFYYICC